MSSLKKELLPSTHLAFSNLKQRKMITTKAERGTRHVAELVKQKLWTSNVHLAKTFQIDHLLKLLEDAEQSGHVKKKQDGELYIYCYTPKCQLNPELWTVVTLLARGLILWIKEVDEKKHVKLIATPFLKFFNLLQDGIETNELIRNTEMWEITRKIDGSLGILFWDPTKTKWRISTKATFFSKQAEWATDFLEKNIDTNCLVKGSTYLTEILYKKNKVVISYDNEDLILLAGFQENGIELTREELERIEKSSKTEYKRGFCLVDICKYDNFDNMVKIVKKLDGHKEEGIVIKLTLLNGGNYRIKVKSDEYLELHRSISWTDKQILNAMISSVECLNDLRNKIPDESVEKFDAQVDIFYGKAKTVVLEVLNCVSILKEQGCKTKRDVGLWLKDRNYWPNGEKIIKQ